MKFWIVLSNSVSIILRWRAVNYKTWTKKLNEPNSISPPETKPNITETRALYCHCLLTQQCCDFRIVRRLCHWHPIRNARLFIGTPLEQPPYDAHIPTYGSTA